MKSKKKNRINWALLLMQLAVWAVIVMLPSFSAFVATLKISSAITVFKMVWFNLQSPCLVYFINFYLLGPYLFFKKRYKSFIFANLGLLAALNWGIFFVVKHIGHRGMEWGENYWLGYLSGLFVYFLLNLAAIVVSIGLRNYLHSRKIKQQLDEEKHKSTEAELAWLKNQLHPHFIFNTLNNISSLTQIDPDKAQDAIAQMSELLRYALYETNKQRVPIKGETEFINNYVELVKIRLNEKTTVSLDFDIENPQYPIAPLLFISIIENAFKHGVSSNRDSMVAIRLAQHDNTVTFSCDNTNYPKKDSSRSGSGIGLDNTQRRLQLTYGDHFEWEQDITEADNMYHIKITLQS